MPFQNLLPHVTNAMVRMESLTSILINNTVLLQDSMLAHLASLHSLTDIYVDGTLGCPSFRPLLFPHLRNLLITCRDARPAEMLSLFIAPSLEKITVLCTWDAGDLKGSDEHVTEWLDILSRAPPHLDSNVTWVPPLQQFIAVLGARERQILSDYGLQIDAILGNGPDVLRALTRFRFLRTIRIEIDSIISIDNKFVRTLAEGLPNIEELSLTPPPGVDFQPRSNLVLPTFDSLVAFSEHCLRLSMLSLPIRATFASYTFWHTYRTSTAGRERRLSSLKTLALWTTPMIGGANAKTVSIYLGWIFPALVSLRPYVQAAVGRVFDGEMRRVARAEWTVVLDEMGLGGEVPP